MVKSFEETIAPTHGFLKIMSDKGYLTAMTGLEPDT